MEGFSLPWSEQDRHRALAIAQFVGSRKTEENCRQESQRLAELGSRLRRPLASLLQEMESAGGAGGLAGGKMGRVLQDGPQISAMTREIGQLINEIDRHFLKQPDDRWASVATEPAASNLDAN